MLTARGSLLLFIGVVIGGLSLFLSLENDRQSKPSEDDWKNHPVLAEPDGESHRGDKQLGADIHDPRILAELSRRFRATTPLRIVQEGARTTVRGADDLGRRQEYLLRLLDYYWFSKRRLVGMARGEVEGIFGPLAGEADRAEIRGGRDLFLLWFKEGRVYGAYYAMGY